MYKEQLLRHFSQVHPSVSLARWWVVKVNTPMGTKGARAALESAFDELVAEGSIVAVPAKTVTGRRSTKRIAYCLAKNAEVSHDDN